MGSRCVCCVDSGGSGGLAWLRVVGLWVVNRCGYAGLSTDPAVILPQGSRAALQAVLQGEEGGGADVVLVHDKGSEGVGGRGPFHVSLGLMLVRPSLRTYHLMKQWASVHDVALQWRDPIAAFAQVEEGGDRKKRGT